MKYLSLLVKNVLYIGKNAGLVEALLTSISDGNQNISYKVKHMLNSNEILTLLAEKQYHYLITEQAVPAIISEKIQCLFPQLHATYLEQPKSVNEKVVKLSLKKIVSDDVKNALDYISVPIYYKSQKGKILLCNNSFANQLGLRCNEVIGKYITEILPASLQDGLEIVDKKILNDHQVHLYRCELHDLSGRAHEVVFRKELIAGTDIQIGMVFDVSELNEAKRNTEKERMMLRATADISSDLIFFKDLKSRFLGCNKQFEKFIGQPEKLILGKKDDHFFEFEQAIMCQKQDQDVMFNNQTYCGEEYLTYVDGERHFIEMKKVPLLDNKGEVQGLIGIGRDITAHHLLQKRLKVANAVFENSQENIIVTDQADIIISANLSSSLLTGYKQTELLGRDISMLSTNELSSSIHIQIEEALKQHKQWKGDVTYRNKLKEIQFAWLDVYVVELEEGVSNRIYTFTDLNQNKNIESKIQYLSKHDPLTGLPNRIALFSKLEDAIHRANFNEIAMAVVLVDINNFKAINDQYGHDAGDKILQEIALRLKNCIFEKDCVARFGDDEFVIIVDSLKNEHDAALVAQKVAKQFSEKFNIGGVEVTLSATIGISLCPDDGTDVDGLLQSAEKAMLRAKLDKNNAYHFYTGQLTEHSSSQLQLETELKIALKLDQFEIYYQPQYDLNKKLIVGMESLLRWNHPLHGLLLPKRFLSLAEESGLLNEIGLKMLEKIAKQTVAWKKSNINFGRIAINLSVRQLEKMSFIADVQSIIKETGCSSQDIEFEVTEATFESDNYTVRKNLFNIKKLGIALTVDDFGANISILHFIESLGIEKLKIASNYIHGASDPLVAEVMIKSMMVLARELGISIVGEKIESVGQESSSIMQQITIAQDNYKGKAMKGCEATFYLRCHKKK